MDFSEALSVTHSIVCPYTVWESKYAYLVDAMAGNFGTLEIIQNPLLLPKANAPEAIYSNN